MSRIHSIFKQSALAAALALVTLATPAAFAQSQHRGDDRGHYDDRNHDHRNDRGDYRDGRRDYRDDRRDHRDYRSYRLAPPPRGYAWVRPYQNDDTYYMVQIASGLIAQIFNNR